MALEKIRPRVVDESGNYTFNNVTATGNLVTLNANLGNVATANYIKTNNLQYANGVSWPIGGAVTASGSNTQIQFNNAGSLGSSANFVFDRSTNRLTVDNITANGAALTNLTGANISGSVGNANFAAYAGNITIAAQSNITSVGTLTSLTVTGNITTGNANLGNFVIANFFSGSGNNLSNIQASNITGAVAYATTANSVAGANVSGAVTYAATANAVAGANVLGDVANATYAVNAGTAYSVSASNISGTINLANFATTANSVAGANVSGFVANANVANTAFAVAGANVSGQVSNALVAGTVYSNAQPNITSVGTLTSLTVTGNVTGGNLVTAGKVYSSEMLDGGTGIYLAAGPSGYINFFTTGGDKASISDTGNIIASNVIANSTIFAVTANISGNVTAGNANLGNAVTANYFVGSGIYVTGVAAATAATVTTNAQPNITSVGTLSSLSVTGDIGAANLTLTGNLIVSGSTTSVNSTVTRIVDPIFELGAGANGAGLSADDNKDRGLLLHYYSGASPVDAFMGWDDSNAEFAFGSNVTVASEVTTFNSLGNVRANFILGNGYYLTGIDQLAAGSADVANSIANGTSNINTPTAGGNITVGIGGSANRVVFTTTGVNIAGYANLGSGNLTTTGNVTANFFSGNGNNLSNLTFGNITAFNTAGLTTDELYLQSTTRLNVTASGSSGYIFDQYGVTVNPVLYVTSGQTLAFNLDVTGHPFLIQTSGSANYSVGLEHVDTTGTVSTTTSAQGKIAGTLYWKVPYGITGNYKYQCSIHGGMVGNIVVTDANVANIQVANATIASTVYTNAQPNITSVGTLSSLAVTGNITSGNANLGNLVTANYFSGSGIYITGVAAATAATVTTNAQPNITSVGTLSNLIIGNATANTTFGNGTITATGNISFTGANVSLGDASNLKITGGTAGYFITTDGAGNLSWGAAAGGGGVGATGSNTQIQFNDGGVLGASANLVFSKTTNTFTTGRVVASAGANLGNNVSNLYIGGGGASQILSTDGSGNLSWIAQPTAVITVDNFTGNGVQTTFTLSTTPSSINQTVVNYNGAFQLRSAYTLTGPNITFSEAPANGSLIEVTTTMGATSGAGAFVTRTYTGNGVATTYTVTSGVTVSSVLVTENGLVQTPTVDYTIAGSTLTFIVAPANGIIIQIRELAISIATTNAPVYRAYTGNGVANTFTITSGLTANSLIVAENGIIQRPTTDYSVSGSNVVFINAPASNVDIQIRELSLNGGGTSSGISLPTQGGNSGKYLTTDGATTSWANVGGSLTIKEEGSNLTTTATSIDFVGGGVTATNTGNAVTVTIPSGSNNARTTGYSLVFGG